MLLKMGSLKNIRSFSRLYSSVGHLEPVALAFSEMKPSNVIPNEKNPVIVLHGLLGSKSNWSSIAKQLCKETTRTFYTVDARNHGDSPHSPHMTYEHMAQDLAKFLEDHGLRECCFIGHSMGGRAVMYLALTQPHLVEKLVVVDIVPNRSTPDLLAMKTLFNALMKVQIAPGTPVSEARQLADVQLQRDIKDPKVRQFLLMNLDTSKAGGPFKANIKVLQEAFTDHIAKFPPTPTELQFKKATLFVAGGESQYVMEADRAPVGKMFPTSSIVWIPGAGHWVHADAANKFMQLVGRFLM